MKNGGKMNPSTSSMDVYTVSEDGGSFRLLGLDELLGKWMLEMKTFSTMYLEGIIGTWDASMNTKFF